MYPTLSKKHAETAKSKFKKGSVNDTFWTQKSKFSILINHTSKTHISLYKITKYKFKFLEYLLD